jgi:hypothetical protein
MGTTANQKKLFFNLRKAKSKISALEEGDPAPRLGRAHRQAPLGFQRSLRPEQSDQRAPDQPAKITHRERVSADSQSRSAVLGLR